MAALVSYGPAMSGIGETTACIDRLVIGETVASIDMVVIGAENTAITNDALNTTINVDTTNVVTINDSAESFAGSIDDKKHQLGSKNYNHSALWRLRFFVDKKSDKVFGIDGALMLQKVRLT